MNTYVQCFTWYKNNFTQLTQKWEACGECRVGKEERGGQEERYKALFLNG